MRHLNTPYNEKAMNNLKLENELLDILKSRGLKKEEMKEVIQNLNSLIQNSEEEADDFFLRLKNSFIAQASNSGSEWLSSDEIDSYL
jgi:hypothetical protein